ncbi:IclR family transcriptional regulator [Actinocorallia populi]|uniref:IclR family transcriptional regulator n=1 Tax=Actinocorallia populi TaxID=2079200 RepID=UPI0018E5275F|nr:helix-turn-helix domain-containing protein [Actinocorallia populi]
MAMIDRVASLLEVFSRHHHLTLAQVSRQAHLPRSSTHRILQHLVELGWLERRGYQYTLGIGMFELGARAVQRSALHQAALPAMHALHRSTGLTVHLSTLVSSDILHLERIGCWPATGEGWLPASRQPAVHTAAGRALLAQLEEAEWPEPLFPPSPASHGLHTRTRLRRALDAVRDRGGVAIDAGGCAADTTVVAAPIGPPEGDLRTALSLCGPTGAVQMKQASDTVRIAAMDLWYASSGFNFPRRRTPRLPIRTAFPATAQK